MYSWITSLQGRLTLGFAVVLALSLASVSVYSAYATRIETERFAAEIELARAGRAEQLVRDTFEANRDWNEVQYAIQQVGNLYGWRVVLENESGMIVADSHQLVRDAQGLFETFAERFARPARFTRRPVVVNGELIGYLLVDERPGHNERPLSMRNFFKSSLGRFLNDGAGDQLPPPPPPQTPSQTTSDLVAEVLEYVDPPLSNLQASFQRSLLIAGIASGLAGLLIVTMFTRQALAPIRGLTAAASRLGTGDLSQRVPESGSDDIGELAKTFNTMASDLELAREQSRQLTADVAHELRTPLTNIQGYLEAIKDGVVDADDETIETLHSQTIHLANLVEDLRIVAIADAGALALNKSFASPVPVIEDAVLNFAQRAREQGVELTVSKTGSGPVIEFDETRLRQIVTNLVENALIHTPKGGRVTVEISDPADGLKLSVSDTGAGISSNDLPRIFDQFYRADPSRTRVTGGAGLGLTIVKRLAEAHGGTVTVASSPGEGTTFTVLIPGRQT
ncbi:MAG: HAMP domain-containing protein [Chloroflexi bacterium]|nr:HAMP domain-containing protein [Chloroflexota bacterium]